MRAFAVVVLTIGVLSAPSGSQADGPTLHAVPDAASAGGRAGFGIGGTAVLRSGVATLQGVTIGSLSAAVAVEPDGRIVVAADDTSLADTARPTLELFRLTSSGEGSGFGRSQKPLMLHGCSGTGLVAQPDGKLVVACGHYVERLDPSGTPDFRFGDHGVATVPGSRVGALALAPGGKLVAGGEGVLLRLLSNGELDPSFGSGGTVLVPVPFDTLAVDGEGRIVVPGGGPSPSILRYDATGAPDTTFGSSGSVTVAGFPEAVAVRPDDRIVAAVDTAVYGQVEATQLLPDGTLDASFGTGGIGVVSRGYSSGAQSTYAAATTLALEPDGAVVVGGAQLPSPGSYGYAAWFVKRLLANGSPAKSAPSPGFFDLDTDCSTEVADAIAGQPNGKVVVVGDACESGDAKPVLFATRYTSALTFDAGPLLTHTPTQLAGRASGATVAVVAQLGPSAAFTVTARVQAPLRLLPGSSIGGKRLAHPAQTISTRGPWSRPITIHLFLPRRALVHHHAYVVELTATDRYGKTARSTLHFRAP